MFDTAAAWAADAATLTKGVRALFRPSLQRQARLEVRRHLADNPEARRYRAGFGRRVLQLVRTYPVVAFTAVLMVYVSAGLIAWHVQRCIGNVAVEGCGTVSADRNGNDVASALRDVNAGLLSAQAALVALIYPLVVALIATLTGARATAAVRLRAFLSESEATTTGMLAVLLCGVAGSAMLFVGLLPYTVAATVTALNLAWFVLSLLGLSFFLSVTLQFLSPSSRAELLRRHVADSIWPKEIPPRLANANIMSGAGLEPWLGKQSGNEDESRPRVNLPSFGLTKNRRTGEITLRKHLRSGRWSMYDVHTPVLGVVGKAWLRRAERAVQSSPSGWPPFGPELDLRAEQKRVDEGYAVLAKVPAEVPLTLSEGWLLRRAYRFQQYRPDEVSSATEDVLRESLAEVLMSLRSGSEPDFEDRIGEVVALHGLLLRLAAIEGGQASLAVISDGGWWRSIAQAWASAYRELIDEAIGMLPRTRRPFLVLSTLPVRIALEAGNGIAVASILPTEDLAYRLALDLVRQARAARGHSNGLDQNPTNEIETPVGRTGQARDWLDETWIRLTGTWESHLRHISSLPESANDALLWRNAATNWPLVEAHLRRTLKLAAWTALNADRRGGERAVDLLLHWPSKLTSLDGRRGDWLIKQDRVSPTLLSVHEWNEVSKHIPLRVSDSPATPTAAINAARRNAFSDGVLALELALVQWAITTRPGDPLIDIAGRVVRRIRLDTEGGTLAGRLDQKPNLAERLTTIVRLWRGNEKERAGRIEEITAELGHLHGRATVPGRGYASSFEPEGVRGRKSAQAALLVLAQLSGCSTTRHGVAATLSAAGPEPAFEDFQAAEHLGELVREAARLMAPERLDMLNALAGVSEECASTVVDALHQVRALLRASANALCERYRQAILTSSPSDVRLASLRATAAEVFSPAPTTRSWLALFQRIRRAKIGTFQAWRLRVLFSKGELTDPPLIHPDSNEADLIRTKVGEAVASLVLHQTMAAVLADNTASTPERWWEAIASSAEALRRDGKRPTVIVGKLSIPDWAWEELKPKAVEVGERHRQVGILDYHSVLRLSGVEFHVLDAWAEPLVVPHDFFDEAIVYVAPSGEAVQVECHPNDNDPTKVVVAFSGRLELGFRSAELAVRVPFPSASEPKPRTVRV
jgi:hypothetical protein